MKSTQAARTAYLGVFAAAALLAHSTAALAHAADRGFILLLPTGYYLVGGAAAVALSFIVLATMPASAVARLLQWKLPLVAMPYDARLITSLASLIVIALLWYAGLYGSRDPLSNPLPLVFWSVFWVGFTLLVGFCGNLWRWLEPWYGPSQLILGLIGRRQSPPPFSLPQWLGYAPAILLLFGFGWFELVYPSPEDPARLAIVLITYWLFNLAGILAFGHIQWTGRVELFSVFFAMISRLAPFQRADEPDAPRLYLRFPGGKVCDTEALPPSGMLFLLLALATVSFDGLMRTFFWLGLSGVNPLEYPGRSALVLTNTLGLFAAFVLLSSAFIFCVWLGRTFTRSPAQLRNIAGLLVWSIVPIALAYHFAHYLGSFVLNGQYALTAISDPLARGWNLFGTAGYHVLAGATAGYQSAWVIWNFQAAAIIGGHLLAVLLAHALSAGAKPNPGTISQIPLAILMVGYTVFGLWLLSSPTGS